MDITRIKEHLQKLNRSLDIQKQTKSNCKLEKYIPEFKLENHKNLLIVGVTKFIDTLIEKVAEGREQMNKKDIIERQSYAERQIKAMNNLLKKYNPEKIKTIENLKGTIDHLKEYNNRPLPCIRVEEEDTVKIFKFLSNIKLEEKYAYLYDYLKRKIIFDFKKPTEKEISSLKKLLKKENDGKGS